MTSGGSRSDARRGHLAELHEHAAHLLEHHAGAHGERLALVLRLDLPAPDQVAEAVGPGDVDDLAGATVRVDAHPHVAARLGDDEEAGGVALRQRAGPGEQVGPDGRHHGEQEREGETVTNEAGCIDVAPGQEPRADQAEDRGDRDGDHVGRPRAADAEQPQRDRRDDEHRRDEDDELQHRFQLIVHLRFLLPRHGAWTRRCPGRAARGTVVGWDLVRSPSGREGADGSDQQPPPHGAAPCHE